MQNTDYANLSREELIALLDKAHADGEFLLERLDRQNAQIKELQELLSRLKNA